MRLSEEGMEHLEQIAHEGNCVGIQCSNCPISYECRYGDLKAQDRRLSNQLVAAKKLSELISVILEDALMEENTDDD